MKRGYAERAFRLCFRKRINELRSLYGITARPCMASADRLYSPFPFGLDSILAKARFHTLVNERFHARLRRDFSKAFCLAFSFKRNDADL